MTIATTGAIAPLEAFPATPKKLVTYHVRGFSCITCATGLDTMLRQQKGITSSSSTYPQGNATIGFDPAQITELQIKDFIASLGFTLDDEQTLATHPTEPTLKK